VLLGLVLSVVAVVVVVVLLLLLLAAPARRDYLRLPAQVGPAVQLAVAGVLWVS
jgi:hypothetical protein